MATNTCSNIQKSLAWCQGTPVLPGIKRRLYYIAKSGISSWPKLPKDSNGRVTSAVYVGEFASSGVWQYIDINPDKSQLTSEAQGELPSQTQLNKLVAVHPGVGPEATAMAAYINNTDSVFLVEDMDGRYRIIGNEMWSTTCKISQDLGQGPTGTASTTIEITASDVTPAPFYEGVFETVDGPVNLPTGSSD